MPISFPSNPSSGDTYDFGGIHYIYNGDGWVNKSIYGISAGSNISFANYNGTGPIVISATDTTGITSAVTSFNGYTGDVVGWAWYNDGIGSTLDAGLIHGISGQRFVENLQTGLLYGGLIQVNAGNSALFDITAGSGIVSFAGASLTAYPVPSLSYVNWGNFTGLTLSGITSYEETWVSINSSGNVVQQNTKWSDSQFDTSIPLGVLIHPNNASINFGVAIPHVAYGQPSQLDPFVRAFGPIKISGHEISANGANLQLNKSSGSAYIIGRNYSTDPSSPNVVEDTNATPITTIYRYYRDGSGKFTIVTAPTIDPANYDDGSGTLNPVAGGQYTIQRMFFLPGVPSVLGVYYGRETYSSIQTAQANIPFEQFNEDDSTASLGVFAGYLIVRSGATQLNNTSDAKFISSGIFRNLSNIGGGGVAVANLDDLTDVAITSVANNNVLKYDSGTSQWVNASLTSFFTDYVSSFNGKTGAVQGVSAAVAGTGISVSGATGSVTITNTGVLSFNGNTGAVQGVSSINGNTGAISNVAFTNTAQSFTGLQQFTQGISAAGITTDALRVCAAGSTRFLEFIPGINNQIIARGNSTLNLLQQNYNPIYIGDFDAGNNATYIEVDDFNQVIKFYFNGDSYTFPIGDGDANDVLATDGAGQLSWIDRRFYIPALGATGYNERTAATETLYAVPIGTQTFTGGVVATNTAYFNLFYVPTTTAVNLMVYSFNTVTTGNFIAGIYKADGVNGLPNTRIYSSSSTAVSSGFAFNTVTAVGGVATLDPGLYYTACIFNNTPTMAAVSGRSINPWGVFSPGSADFPKGYSSAIGSYSLPSTITTSFVWKSNSSNTAICFITKAP